MGIKDCMIQHQIIYSLANCNGDFHAQSILNFLKMKNLLRNYILRVNMKWQGLFDQNYPTQSKIQYVISTPDDGDICTLAKLL